MGKQVINFICNAVAEQAPPLLNNGLGQYQYKGCYVENNPGRQLQTQLYGSDKNTAAMCIAACAQGGWRYCGTQYHSECWAGNSIPRQQTSEIDCNFDCSGDLNQICGGNGNTGGGSYISLFYDTTQGNDTGPPPGPVVNPGVSGYTSIGCYTEAKNGRALPNGVAIAKKTVKYCLDACKANAPNGVPAPYTYAGLEYGGECWCGNAFTAGSVPAPIGDCNMLCNDNATEYCGAGSRLNVYQLGGTTSSSTTTTVLSTSSTSVGPTNTVTTPTTTTSTSTPTPTGPARKPVVKNVWKAQGCWTEITNGPRALSSSSYADDSMTLESCATFCANFNYFGVEYGRECYCGDVLDPGSAQAPQDDCSFTCPGDGSEYCGAGNRLELYKRTLNTPTGDDKVPVDTTSSSIITTTTSTSTTTSASTTTSTSTPTPTGPARKAVVKNVWNAQGCWTEIINGPRALRGNSYADNSMTLESCATFCANFNYFGVEYGRECYCGDVLDPGSARAAQADCSFTCPGDGSEYCGAGNRLELYKRTLNTPTDDNKVPVDTTSSSVTTTTAASTGVSSSTSPGHQQHSNSHDQRQFACQQCHHVYPRYLDSSTTTSAKPTSTKPVISEGNANFTYYGCWSEPNKGKLLSKQIYNNATDQSIEKCLEKCATANVNPAYNFAGVEYGQECWCGSTLRLDGGSTATTTQGKNVSGTECSFICPGNKTEYCGAGNRLSTYVLKSWLKQQSASSSSSTAAPKPVMLKY
ncbi:hypothetical protein NLG97_g10585 [Lecanicillium saksenae]|uniref:Uncharacterized protein n=1 Tax=Lecanicillium saksenae TaxID=468837 RepID=A0ACC1QEQ9_9HYPO|nr:hypothetical protein NLG97_g10585 [Lecanicillium saksenae]